jgi:hypothetical protein
MTRALMVLALAAAIAPVAVAHEGHEHKVMGTVSMIHENHLEVKAVKDGKIFTLTVNEKTKIFRDKASVSREEIKKGDRVVVTYVQEKDDKGTDVLIAREVRLGVAAKATS